MKNRTTLPKNNKCYIRQVSGGLNGAVQGSPTIKGANVLCNCVGYANGRFNESIIDPDLKGIVKAFPFQLVCNAENFIGSAKRQGLKISKVPVEGGIMVWQKGSTLNSYDGAGHVAFVEKVYDDGSILTSESGWGSSDWAFKNLRRTNSNGRWGQSAAYKFRGCIINPSVSGKTVPAPKLAVDGAGGPATVSAMQKFFGVTEDGVISNQNRSQIKMHCPALTSVTYGSGGSATVKKLQKWCGVETDGYIGQKTVKAWQKKLGVETDGVFGKASMKAWQSFLNDQLFGKDAGSETKKTDESASKNDENTAKTDYLVIDISYVQKSINWKKVKAAGIKGAIIRCGYRGYGSGKLMMDDMFMDHIKGAHAAGLKIGVYFFTEGITAKEGKEEAAYTLNLVKKAGIPIDYPIAVDTEHINAKGVRANDLSKAKRTEVIKAFCEEIKRQGYEPMIYASLTWFYNKLDMSKLPYKIWCAQYYKECQYSGEYVMWQYSSTGKVDGISGVVDMNHCYIENAQNNSNVTTNNSKVTANVAALSIDELAKQVIEGKWGSGADRKKNLEKAGYNYDKVQAKVNEILADTVLTREEIIANMNAWAKKIAGEKHHYVTWKGSDPKTKTCPVCNGRKYDDHYGWNCIGFAFAVWHHGGGLKSKCNCHVISNEVGEQIAKAKTDAEALKIVKKHVGINEVTVIRNNGKNVPKSKWKAGDIGLMFNGDTYKHTFYIMGDGEIADSSGRGGDGSNDIAIRSDKNYSARIIVRWTGGKKEEKKTYTGELPSTSLIKTNAEVIADAIKWLKWIAGDNTFHYGYTNKHGSDDPKKWNPNAHHNGCYFCDTNTDKGGRSKKGIVDFEHTYCCNPLIGAAWAHGGCVPKALEMCKKGSSWGFSKGSGYDKSNLFANLGKPKKADLKAGDVLCSDTHVAMYIGGGKIVEAAHGDDNKKGSEKWNDSIHITALSDKRYDGFKRVHRFKGSVNTTRSIFHGEVGKRVELLQKFLIWYGLLPKGGDDGLFGDATLKAVKAFQKASGITADGIVGPNTITAIGKAVK